MVAMPEGGIQVTSHSRLLIPGHFLFPTLGKPSSAIYGRAAPWANPKPFLFYINFHARSQNNIQIRQNIESIFLKKYL